MLLVPRQLLRAGMTGSVPYCSGRFTPAQAYAASHPYQPPPATPSFASPLGGGAFTGVPVPGQASADSPTEPGSNAYQLVSRDENGTLHTIDIPDEVATDLGEVAAALLGRPDSASLEQERNVAQLGEVPTWSLADSVPIGGTAAVALIEHTWAAPLRDAIQQAGGTPLEETWLAPADLELVEGLMAER